jgi:hypothetical protein
MQQQRTPECAGRGIAGPVQGGLPQVQRHALVLQQETSTAQVHDT